MMARSGTRLALAILTLACAAGPAQSQALTYPPAPRADVVDDYFGTRVPDPFRPLEAMSAAPTVAWVDAENELSLAYLDAIPELASFRRRLEQLGSGDRFGVPAHAGGLFVYTRRTGLQPQPALYMQRSLRDPPRVLLDPNQLAPDGSLAVLPDLSTTVSPDGRFLAYSTTRAGSDWTEIHVREIASGHDRPDRVRWVKYSWVSWTRDSRGFFYSRYPEPAGGDTARGANANHQIWYHRVGAAQASDVLIYARPDQPKWYLAAAVTPDGRYLVIIATPGGYAPNRIYLLDLVSPRRPRLTGQPVPLLDAGDARYVYMSNRGPVFYFRTNKDAPRFRVIAVDARQPEPAAWRTVVPEGAEAIQGAELVGDRVLVHYLRDAHSLLALFRLDGQPAGEIPLPGPGAVGDISGRPGEPDVFFLFTSFLQPPAIFHYSLRTGRNEVFHAPVLDFDASRFETRQVFYAAKDGTRIPMFLTYRRGLRLDGQNPTILKVYGGFSSPALPAFTTQTAAWVESGGIWAQPGIRGGGEYGEAWHQAGMKGKKQTTFDDAIAAAEYLVHEGYTSPSRLALRGSSNGGLVVAAVMLQRPDLFAVALPNVAVTDMLRFLKYTVGAAWASEYGSPETPEGFRTLYAYSPLHNVKPGTCYPATLVTTGDRDEVVVPAHSYKFAAALQAAQGCDRPILLRVATATGHGFVTPTAKAIEESADMLAFAWKSMGLSRVALP